AFFHHQKIAGKLVAYSVYKPSNKPIQGLSSQTITPHLQQTVFSSNILSKFVRDLKREQQLDFGDKLVAL
ncbi:479_t:CDS:2, partial [Funneliformis geosporum]